MRHKLRRILSVLCITVLVFMLAACADGSKLPSDEPAEEPVPSEEPAPAEPEAEEEIPKVSIAIQTPSPGELKIAYGRHFKVSGALTGKVPDDATLRVSLLDAEGNEVRHAAADRKGTDCVIPYVCGGAITVFDPDTEFSEIAYTAPELVVADLEDREASALDATVKCVYTNDTFFALIVSATDPDHGLAEADGYGLTDHEGKPYDALPEGKYTVRVALFTAGGKEISSASKEIEIGRKSGTVIHEMTNQTVIGKGGKDLLLAWASENDLTILDDLLPGMFGPFYQMSTMMMSVSCETAEYLPGPIYVLLYGNTEGSASNALEIAKYLQLEHKTEDPEVAKYYCFSLGEPQLAGEQARIVPFGDGENMRICRIDRVKGETEDGVFLTNEAQVLGSDTDPSDGWVAGIGTFAVAGVMKPYQLKDNEVVPDDNIYGFYNYLNGAETLVYTFTPNDGSEPVSVTKPVGVSRIDRADGRWDPAVYEFYNVFPEDLLDEGAVYEVIVQAQDRKGEAIEGMTASFTLSAADQNDKLSHEGYTLEQVVVLSRHNIRSPLSSGDSVVGKITPHEWFAWTSPAGELSIRGGVLETAMGQYFREWLEAEGLFTENYFPAEGEVRIYANVKQRTIATARFFSAGLLPLANAQVETHGDFNQMDPVFNPQLTYMSDAYREAATAQILELYSDDINGLEDNYKLLEDVIDAEESEARKDGSVEAFRTDDVTFRLEKDAEPAVEGSLRTACQTSDAMVLQYYEEPDDEKAGFGQALSDAQWDDISEIKTVYVDSLYTAPLVARNVAHPLLGELYSEMTTDGRKFTFLCGHDSNLASVLGALDAEAYELPQAIEETVPIGSKLVFTRWRNGDGEEFWDVDLVYQTPDQMRQNRILTPDAPPATYDISFRGLEENEDGLYRREDLEGRFTEAIGE